ncbi:MAG: dual specificity protein phosphatase family protein [Epsilonproteobacteria bacterium]|nr:dual specificity protein phosphatase family protein [Campylobacterota bacterium]
MKEKLSIFSESFRRKIASVLLVILFASALILGGINLFYISIFGNFHKIDDDAYRSGQLYTRNLINKLKEYKIKSIINLRGENTFRSPWYEYEKEVAKRLGIELINFKIGSREFIDFNKSLKLINILKTAPKPMLIHCRSGADRTSFAAALYEFAVKDKDIKEAKKQLSFYYGHLPYFGSKTIKMDESFDNFVKKYLKLSCKNKKFPTTEKIEK